jgi:hypothetical protein
MTLGAHQDHYAGGIEMNYLSALAATLLALAGAAAHAQSFSSDSKCCGRLYYGVSGDGVISGSYPKQEGQIYGKVDANGTASGTWTQPRSDHPCMEQRHGTFAWGRFIFEDVGTPAISGSWGYCDEVPNRAWGFR